MTNPPIDRFMVNLGATSESRSDLDQQITALDARIERIVEHCTFMDTPMGPDIRVLSHVLRLTRDPTELEMLGKAALRLAPLIHEYERLRARISAADLATEDPGWFAAFFGDFTDEIARSVDLKDPGGTNPDL